MQDRLGTRRLGWYVATVVLTVLVALLPILSAESAAATTISSDVTPCAPDCPAVVGLHDAANVTRGGALGRSPDLSQSATIGDLRAGVATETLPDLAAYGGGKTSGVLVRGDGTTTGITSGLNGPSS